MSTKGQNTTVECLMWAVVGFALVFWLSRSDEMFGLPVLLLLGVTSVFVPWIAGPFLLRLKHEISSRPEFVPFEIDDPGTSEEVRESILDAAALMKPLGFQPVRNYRLDSLVRNTTGFTAYFRNPRTGEAAKLIEAASRSSLGGTSARLTVFITLHADDTEIQTSDSRTNIVTPKYGPPVFSMAFPQVDDPAVLYAVHQARVQDMAVASRPVDAIGNDPDAFMRRTEYRSFGRWVELGYFEPIEGRPKLRPTWKGAALMAWKQVWPSKSIRAAWKRFKAGRELRRLGIDIRGGTISDPFHDALSQ